jgi:hypothetical protein
LNQQADFVPGSAGLVAELVTAGSATARPPPRRAGRGGHAVGYLGDVSRITVQAAA